MRTISNRLRRLENRLVTREGEEASLAARIRERRRFESEGRLFEDKPREDLRGLTFSQIIRRRFSAK